MTKVEEAKAALWGQLVDSGELGEDDANVLLDNLVDAARAEGVEKWKWRTRADKLFGYWVQLLRFPPDERRTLDVETEVNGIQYVMIPASALAPSSERAGGLPEAYGDSLPIKEKP